jgi:hypothetical protein
MRHSDGVSASSYRDYYLSSATAQPPRVPPTPTGHARPFTRSSSVPDHSNYSEALSDIEDALLGLGSSSHLSSASGLDPLSSSRLRPRFQDWRTGSYSISSTLRARGQRSLRLGRQFSVSSELPTSDPLCRTSLYNNYTTSDLGLGSQPLPLPLDRVALSTGPYTGAGLGSKDHDVLLQARSPPLTLGRSLQLVTENFGRYSDRDRRKKTVRFNSEDWHRQAALYGRTALPPYLPTSYTSLGATGLVDDPYLFIEDDSWMSLEDVRSGRWARWDALRQESQDSLARDSGVESGSCFTSSEDSNRGGEFYLSKKVF